MKYSDEIVRDFLSKNINKNTIDTYIKLLGLDHSVFSKLIDLLIEYRITILDVKNSVTSINDKNINDYIKMYELQFSPYQSVPNSSVDGYSYLTETLSLNVLVEQGIQNTIDFVSRDLDDLIPHLSVKKHDNVKAYKDINSLKNEFNLNILPRLLERFDCTTSLVEKFPVTPEGIADLFPTVTTSYVNPSDSSTHSVKDLGIKLYTQMFGQYFGYTNYFSNDNLIFLLYRINERYAKTEISKGMSSMILNMNVPNESVRNFINIEAMSIETKDALPDDEYIKEVLFRIHDLSLSRDINAGFSEFTFIDLMCKNYHQQNNSLENYNGDVKVVMDTLIQKAKDFGTLIVYSYELSNQYLVT